MPDALPGLQVQFLRVAGIGLEDDLVLVEILHPVRVFAVAAIVRADARLDIGHAPGFRPQHAQQGRRVAGPRAHLDIIRLPQHTALFRPELVQLHDDFLE